MSEVSTLVGLINTEPTPLADQLDLESSYKAFLTCPPSLRYGKVYKQSIAYFFISLH